MREETEERTGALLNQAETAATEGRQDKARDLVLEALHRDENNIRAWVLRARLARDRWEARGAWDRVLALDPDHPDARRLLHRSPGEASVDERPTESAAAPSSRWQTLLGIAAFAGQRLAFGALVLAAIIYLSHLGLDMARGTAFGPALSEAGWATVSYLGRLAQGDLGRSVAGSLTRRAIPVSWILADKVSKSCGLLAVSLLIATGLGTFLGIWAARRRHARWSLITLLASITAVSFPSFFAALLLQMGVIQLTRALSRSLLPVGGFGWDRHILLPALVLAARPVAQIARMTFVTVGEVLSEDFVRVARGKGLGERLVMGRHVIRNAAIPVLTTVGVSLRFSLSSLPVVEYFFGWPGVGFTLLKAIARQDDNLTVGLVLCMGGLFILVNLLLEVSYRLIDPRLRESTAGVERRERRSLTQKLKSFLAYLRSLITDNPLPNWLRQRSEPAAESPFRAVLRRRGEALELTSIQRQSERRWAWVRATVGNLPFVIGTTLVIALIAVVFLGPHVAPHSPYSTRGLRYEDGEFIVPPFAPGAEYPWGTDVIGRDMLSLILAGAQQTLRLATMVVAVRMMLGFILGAVAGWLSGSWVDRLLLGAAETIAAFPTLLLAMILILALGIRQGFLPFVIALSFVGWGEVMQYVRAEVMRIRPEPFIDSAVATGLRTPRIILNHVLPNLVPALISLAALEMGAALMLLGELGFVGIFIGGGAFAELQWLAPVYHYSDVPEWGALLSNVRTYAQSYPWMAIYPSLAFFVAILGFNLFGEGMRRLVEDVGARLTRLVNRKTLLAALLLVVAIGWVRGNTGSMAFYQRQASAFDGQRAMAHVEALATPGMDGRALGSQGMEMAADYIAGQFREGGVQPAGEGSSYFQTRDRYFEQLADVPQLHIEDGGPTPIYHEDFAEYAGRFRNRGQARGEVRFVGARELLPREFFWSVEPEYPAVEHLDYASDILLVLSERQIPYFQEVPHRGLLIVAEDEADLVRRRTLSNQQPYGDYVDAPRLWISEATANRLLSNTRYTATDLRRIVNGLGTDEAIAEQTGVTVTIEVPGTVQEEVPVRNVIGYVPGQAASIEGAPVAEAGKLDDHLIAVLAQYDSPPLAPGGTFYPGATDNASGVAIMLDVARTIREAEYEPYKTLLFVAYSGEGRGQGGELTPLEVRRYLQAKTGFSTRFQVEAVVDLRALGTGQGDGLVLSAGGSMRLANLFEEAAGRTGLDAHKASEAVDISIVFEDRELEEGGQEAPSVGVSWQGWSELSRRPIDTIEAVSADKLDRAGRAVSLALMILGRETRY